MKGILHCTTNGVADNAATNVTTDLATGVTQLKQNQNNFINQTKTLPGMKKIFTLFVLFALAGATAGFGQSATWTLTNTTSGNTPVVCGFTTSGPSAGAGVTSVTSQNATSGYSGVGFPTTNKAANYNNTATNYFQFAVTNSSSASYTVSTLNLGVYYNGSNYMYYAIRYSTDGFSSSTVLTNDKQVSTTATGTYSPGVTLAAGTTITFRVYGYYSDAATYRFGITSFQVLTSAPAVPAAFSAAAGNGQNVLSSTANTAGNTVLIAYNTTNTFGTPVAGTTYAAGNSISGGGTVIYNGAAGTYTHTGLTNGTTYYYSIWSVSNSTGCSYSTALTANATPTAPPTKLVITAITPASPVQGSTFSVTVQAQTAGGAASNVTANTAISLSTNGNAGTIGGTVTGTITAGTNSVTISGVTLSGSGTGVTITATRTSGDNLTAGTSATFTVTAYVSAATDYFKTQATGNWNAVSTWLSSPNGTTYYPATLTPTNSAKAIVIQSGNTVTVTANVPVSQVTVNSGGNVTVNNGITLDIIAGTNASDLSISGSVTVNGILEAEDGSLISSTAATLTIGAAGTYLNNFTDDGGTDAGTIPTATWTTGSTCKIIGVTDATGFNGGNGQTFSNFVWECPNQTSTFILVTNGGGTTSITGTLTVNKTGTGVFAIGGSAQPTITIGNFLQTGGSVNENAGSTALRTLNVTGNFTLNQATTTSTFNLAISGATGGGTVNVGGNFSIAAGTLTKTAASGTNTINFIGTSSTPQTYLKTGGTISGAINFAINPTSTGSIVDFGTSVLDGSSGTFTLNSGGTLNTSNTAGLTTTGATGTIQVTGTRTYSSAANYTYNGTSAQITGAFTTSPAASTVNNLTIANTAGVTNSQALSVAGILALNSGNLITTATNAISVTNTATTAITGGSATSYVDGPLGHTLPANLTNSSLVYNFPVGDNGIYLPASLTTINTGSTAPVTYISANSGSSGGSADGTTLGSISNTEYWGITIASGVFSGASISLTRQTAVSPFNAIGKSSSKTGTYSSIGGTASGNSINNSNQTGAIATGLANTLYVLFGQIGTFTLTYNGNGNTGGTVPSSVTQNYNTTTTVASNTGNLVKTGYTFSGWNTAANGTGTAYAPGATFTFTANTTLYAQYTINTFTITASSGANGTVTPAGVTTVNYGSTPTYTITPGTGYHVADVLVDGASVGAVTSYTFTAVSANHTISATFAINTYAITVTQGSNGTIAPVTTTVNYGSNQTFTITPNTGYHIATVLVDGTNNTGAVSGGTYTFTNVTANHTITATYAINTFAITVTQGANGTITPGTTTVNYGSNQTFTITPNTGYHIATVLVDGTNSTSAVSSGSYTFTNVTATHTITATYAINTFTITVTQGANGTIAPGTTTVNYDANQTFTITPNTGYSIATLTVDGSAVTPASSYTFTNVTANHTITATFAINTFTITASSDANGTISPNGATTVNYGSSQTYTITPNSCNVVATLTVDGSSVTPVTSYTFNNVTANHTISVTFTAGALSLNSGAHNPNCDSAGNANYSYGSFDLQGVGGTTPYTYAFNQGNTITTPYGSQQYYNTIPAGTNYTLSVKDATGCVFTKTKQITKISGSLSLSATSSLTSEQICYGKTVAVFPSASPGVAPLTWSVGGDAFTNTRPVYKPAGTYSAVVKDADGCTATTNSVTITQPASPLAFTTKIQSGICNAGRSVTVTPSGGFGSYKYLLATGAQNYSGTLISGGSSYTFINISPGTYTITVADANGCSKSNVIQLTDNSTVAKIAVVTNTNPVTAGSTVTYSVVAIAGQTYTWTLPSGDQVTSGQGTATVQTNWTTSGYLRLDATASCSSTTSHWQEYVTVTTGGGSPAMAETLLQQSKISVYPNPAADVATVVYTAVKSGKYTLTLSDVSGKTVVRQDAIATKGDNIIRLNVGNYANGLYLIKLFDGTGLQSIKMVKAK